MVFANAGRGQGGLPVRETNYFCMAWESIASVELLMYGGQGDKSLDVPFLRSNGLWHIDGHR